MKFHRSIIQSSVLAMRDQYQVEYASATHGFDDLPSTARRNNFANSASPSATVSGGNQAQSVNLSVAEESNTYHRRNISWGLNEVINQGVPGPSLRERSDASSTLSQSQSVRSFHIKPELQGSINLTDSQFHINLPYQGERNTRRTIIELPSGRGIINPMETEAETYLLRAIERTGTEVDSEANILSNVSDAAVQAMRDRQEAEDQNSSPNHSVQHTKVPSREPPSWGGSSATSNRVGFRNVASARNLTSVSPQHIRKMTLDEQLFGLTHAMDAMHAESVVPIEEDIPAISSVPSRLRSNTFESSTGNTSEVPEGREDQRQPASSYEIFAQNADIFYQQALPEAIGHSGPIRRASTRNFGDDTGFGDDKVNESGVTDEEQGKAFTVTNDDNDVKMGKKDASLRGGSSSSTLRVRSPWTRARSVIFDSWGITSEMKNFIRPKQNLIRLYFQIAVLYLALPSLGTAAILFYLVGNPPTGVLANNGNPIDGKLLNTNGEIVDPNVTSVSFYLVFAGVRQVVTFTLAMGTQLVLIDFLAIDRGYLFKLGSRLPLFIMQARGTYSFSCIVHLPVIFHIAIYQIYSKYKQDGRLFSFSGVCTIGHCLRDQSRSSAIGCISRI